MTFLDDYIKTIRMFLPRGQRDDIARELREEIESQAVDKEAELGRPLTDEEAATIIGQYGHPFLTAARYRPQRALIGPLVFPYYMFAIRVLLPLQIAGQMVLALATEGPQVPFGEVVKRILEEGLKELGWFTILAAAIDMFVVKSEILERWHPKGPRGRVTHQSPVANP